MAPKQDNPRAKRLGEQIQRELTELLRVMSRTSALAT